MCPVSPHSVWEHYRSPSGRGVTNLFMHFSFPRSTSIGGDLQSLQPLCQLRRLGNMTCRNIDTTSAHTCTSGSANGATLTYDAEGPMDSWTAPSGTTASDKFL